MLYRKTYVFEVFFAVVYTILGQMSFIVDFPAEHVSVGIRRSVSVCMSGDRGGVMSTYEKNEKSGRDSDMRN